MSRMALNDAIGVLISAADARMEQWRGVGEGISPDDLNEPLWDSSSTGCLEAKQIAEEIEAAIDKVRVFRDAVL